MNTFDTLYFPDTVLPLYQQFPLALFFNTIHLLQPVEAKEDENDSSDPGSYPFTEKGFCQVHTPSKLGVDRDRFLHLLHDIRNKKDAYVEQLSYLTLASLSAPASRGDNSKQAILSSLLQGMEQDTDARDEQERLALWQARLVLKIAEILDQEEEELALQLAAIDDREIDLFRTLQGEILESGEGDEVVEDPFQELLELKQKLCVSEIKVGYWRLYGEKSPDGHVHSALKSLIKQGLVRRAGYALYERTDRSNPYPRLIKK